MQVDEPVQLPIAEFPNVENLPVTFNAKCIERIIAHHIEIPLTDEQMETAEVSTKYVDPVIYDIERKCLDASTLYCLMAYYYYLQHLSENGAPSHRKLMETRKNVTVRAARHIVHDMDEDSRAESLVYGFNPLGQINPEVHRFAPRHLRTSALELAVKAQAKQFLMESPVSSVVESLWRGTLTVEYNNQSNPGGTLINSHNVTHNYQHVLKLISSTFFLILYLLLIQENPRQPSKAIELLFGFWACGYALDEYNQLEEFGSKMYFASLWNIIDVILVLHCLIYGIARLCSVLLPATFPRSFMFARGVLITAGLFVVPRLFSVFDNNQVFTNMVFSLQRVSSDFLISWFVLMMFSVGVWVSVAFSVPHIRFSDDAMAQDESDDNYDRGVQTALVMFKMFSGEADDLWDNWLDYSGFDRIALSFYLLLAQFIMPTVVTAVVANSFANIRKDSKEEFHYMRTIQALQKMGSRKKEKASSQKISPLNVVAWVFEWSRYFLPRWVYNAIAALFNYLAAVPERVLTFLGTMYVAWRNRRNMYTQQRRDERIQNEVDRSLGRVTARASEKMASKERRVARFNLVHEVFASEKITRAMEDKVNAALENDGSSSNESTQYIPDRLDRIEAAVSRIEALLNNK